MVDGRIGHVLAYVYTEVAGKGGGDHEHDSGRTELGGLCDASGRTMGQCFLEDACVSRSPT